MNCGLSHNHNKKRIYSIVDPIAATLPSAPFNLLIWLKFLLTHSSHFIPIVSLIGKANEPKQMTPQKITATLLELAMEYMYSIVGSVVHLRGVSSMPFWSSSFHSPFYFSCFLVLLLHTLRLGSILIMCDSPTTCKFHRSLFWNTLWNINVDNFSNHKHFCTNFQPYGLDMPISLISPKHVLWPENKWHKRKVKLLCFDHVRSNLIFERKLKTHKLSEAKTYKFALFKFFLTLNHGSLA